MQLVRLLCRQTIEAEAAKGNGRGRAGEVRGGRGGEGRGGKGRDGREGRERQMPTDGESAQST